MKKERTNGGCCGFRMVGHCYRRTLEAGVEKYGKQIRSCPGGDAAFAGATPWYAAVTVGSKSLAESESLTRRFGRS